MAISYRPLHETLNERSMNLQRLRDQGIHSGITTSIKKGEHITLIQIERICLLLDVPIEKVVEVIRD